MKLLIALWSHRGLTLLQAAAALYCGWLWLALIGFDAGEGASVAARMSSNAPTNIPGLPWLIRMGIAAATFLAATKGKLWIMPNRNEYFDW